MKKYLLPLLLITLFLLPSGSLWAGGLFPGTAGVSSADLVTYDNDTSGLTADDVQAAIDELKTDIAAVTTSGISDLDDLPGDTVDDNLIDAAILDWISPSGISLVDSTPDAPGEMGWTTLAGFELFGDNSESLTLLPGSASNQATLTSATGIDTLSMPDIGVTMKSLTIARVSGTTGSSTWYDDPDDGDLFVKAQISADGMTESTTYTWPKAYPTADGMVLTSSSLGIWTWTAGGGTGIANIVEDTTPQLGGDLDVNGKELQSTGNIVLQLGDAAGTNKLSIQDSGGVEIFAIDSNGGTTSAASANPALNIFDSDAPGSAADDKQVGQVWAEYVSGDEDAENSSIGLKAMVAGALTDIFWYGAASDKVWSARDLDITGEVYTSGGIDFTGADAPVMQAGLLTWDTLITDMNSGGLTWNDGATTRVIVDIPIGTTLTDDYVVAYDADTDGFTLKAAASGSGSVEDDAYGAGWDTDATNAPSQNAVYDQLNVMPTLAGSNVFTGANDIGDLGDLIRSLLDSTPATDSTGGGIYISVVSTAGLNIAAGDLVCIYNTGGANGPIVGLADADSATTVGAIFLALEAINADAAGKVLVQGIARLDSWTWSGANKALYVDTTAGDLTETAPSGSGDQVQKLGYTLTPDIIMFNPSVDIGAIPTE